MKYVIDFTIAENWYLPNRVTIKALDLRQAFFKGTHEFLAPDLFLAECAQMLFKAEKQGLLTHSNAEDELRDLQLMGIPLHPFPPLLWRAGEITRQTRLTLFASLYVALAEREQCLLLTADQHVIRATRKHFSFVVDFATLP